MLRRRRGKMRGCVLFSRRENGTLSRLLFPIPASAQMTKTIQCKCKFFTDLAQAGTGFQEIIRFWNLQPIKEGLRHLIIIVLPGMNNLILNPCNLRNPCPVEFTCDSGAYSSGVWIALTFGLRALSFWLPCSIFELSACSFRLLIIGAIFMKLGRAPATNNNLIAGFSNCFTFSFYLFPLSFEVLSFKYSRSTIHTNTGFVFAYFFHIFLGSWYIRTIPNRSFASIPAPS